MIDYEQEIQGQLREFQRLSGKGNVRGSNDVLYEIVGLLLNLIAHKTRALPRLAEQPPPAAPMPPVAINNEHAAAVPDTEDDPPIAGEHITISSSALQHPQTLSEGGPVMMLNTAAQIEQKPLETASPEPGHKVNAPHGLTKFGNPRRIRPSKRKTPLPS